jgi:hypothetical protein
MGATKRRLPLTLFMIVGLLAALSAVPAAADHPDEPYGTPLVSPTTFAGNDACNATRINSPITGHYEFTVDDFPFEVDIVTDGTYFSFTSNVAVQQVIAKGGPNHNVYDYLDAGLFGVTHDSGLHSPLNPNHGSPYGLSHISFCFDDAPIVPEGTLDVAKTAAGTYDREVEWTLTKSVVPGSHSGGPGDVFTSDWEVIATKIDSGPHGFSVTGEIEVGWAGDFAASVEVNDVLNDGTVAVVDCGDGTNVIDFPTGTSSVTCGYVAAPGDASATLNSVELTVLGDPPGDISGDLIAQADVGWTENLTGDDAALLEDDRLGHSEIISSSTTLDYPEDFACPTDRTLYVDGLYEATFPNAATLTGDVTALSASAEVTIECRLIFVAETVTGAGADWSRIQGAPRTWFQYTVGTEGTFDLVQGRKLTDVGDVTVTDLGGGMTELTFTLDDPWILNPDALGNVKVEPLDAKPATYLSPGEFTYHFTASGSSFSVMVPTGSYGYAIHLDAGYWD